ncbi:MAG: 6-bladed beta-propeller [Rhodothermaceae bacterium]|nr:6-bladed beta-propeller [Rhodothermaceae bacterium]MXW32058.1 6-bladed beta-propeller [Rhodothermaceae bacterium]MYC05197.1 6-bladed beta-propeller [Rhodothermaceae bacterium]MYI17176.1 6-bladed beta-propeller [Rhodothermaceae bacterium]MYJ20173.1 6-bladed beta-propeller [Rhodothermaceae bacterium]
MFSCTTDLMRIKLAAGICDNSEAPYIMKKQTWNGYLTTPLILFCIILLTGCGRGADPVQQEGEAVLITLEEILRLGDESAGDTILFGPIAQIAVTGDGDILVSEGQRSRRVHALAADGTYLSQVGGVGQGPGEYQYYIDGPFIGAADSVYLWASWPSQILVYDPENFSYVRSVHVEADGPKSIDPVVNAIEDGWYMEMGLPTFLIPDDGPMTINDDRYSELIKVNRDGSYSTDPLGIVPDREVIPYMLEGGGRVGFVGVPFARSPALAVGRDNMLYYGWNDAIEIAIVSADGSTRDTIRYEHDPVPITDSEMDEASHEEDPDRQQLLAAREPHETKPAFQTFVVDGMNRVWIKLSSPEDATEAEWLILSRESHAVGRTTLPIAVDLEVIRDGYAYGIHQGDGAAPMVVVYMIQE